ncbi:MAG: M13 family metallopeptidase [Oscillospiraceae bacterium]|nr:M13 family metallopeptidase [Oscillospiraceae bacterium]
MKRIQRLTALLSAVAVTAVIVCGCTSESIKEETVSVSAKTETIDISAIRPQEDFYGSVNARRLLETVPAYGEMTFGTFEEIDAETVQEVFSLIKNITEGNETYEPGSTEYLLKEICSQAMNFEDNATVMLEISGLCHEIENAENMQKLMKLWAELYRSYGANPPFTPLVKQDYFKSGEYALMIDQSRGMCGAEYETISDSDDDCISMKNNIRNMLMAVGYDKNTADSKAAHAVCLALEIAHSTDFSAGKSENPFAAFTFVTEEEMNQVFSHLDESIIKLFFGLDENPYHGWYVKDKEQLEKINTLLTDEYLEQWKTLLISELVNANMEFLSTEAESLAAYSTAEDRESAVCLKLATMFYFELSDIYTEIYYTPEMDRALKEMCEQLRQSYRELISDADWLTENGRKALLKKLENMRFILPDSTPLETDPARAELIKDSYPETLRAVREMSYDDTVKNIGAKFDKNRPGMASFEVNACYNPNNTVTITAAIMHAPFFDLNADEGTNFGGLGWIIGHEMGHGFDTTCMDYNENGEYAPDWLSEADRQAFRERAEKMQTYFSGYTVLDIYHVDGIKTSGENYADLGSVECIVNILKDDSNQLRNFFENYAVTMAETRIDSYAIESLETDEHSPGKVRVNAVLSSCDAFYKLYNVKEGDGMYYSPEERVSRW